MNTLFENQTFSERTLKNTLLKNLGPENSPELKELNNLLTERVNNFWDTVIVPMQKDGKFDGNKIVWYYDIYKEAQEARRIIAHPFEFVKLDEELIKSIVVFYNGRTLAQYLELGSTFLVNTMNILLAWHKTELMMRRRELLYKSTNPVDWIYAAQREEVGEMKNQTSSIPGVTNIINNISLILSRRV